MSVGGYDIVKHFSQIRGELVTCPAVFPVLGSSVEEICRSSRLFSVLHSKKLSFTADIYQYLEPYKSAAENFGWHEAETCPGCALIHKPTVLFLDEPTTGVDPVSRKEFWEMLKRLKDQGISTLVSTPYMDEAGMCDRIAFMQNGQFLKIDTPANIISGFNKTLWAVRGDKMSQLLSDLRKIPGVKSCFAFGDTHHVTVDTNILSENGLIKALSSQGHLE